MKKNIFYLFFSALAMPSFAQQITMPEAFALCEGNAKMHYCDFVEHKSDRITHCEMDSFDHSMPYLYDPCELIDIAKKYVGAPYRYGGKSNRGFDCSGFMGYIFGCLGFSLPRSSDEIAKIGREIPREEVKIGDLMFFKRRANQPNNHIGHVGLVVDIVGEEIHVIHASTTKGVVIEKFQSSDYFKKAYITTRRILPAN